MLIWKVSKGKSEIKDSGFENPTTQMSACKKVNNEFPTDIPMLSGSCNRTRLLCKQPDVSIIGELKDGGQ